MNSKILPPFLPINVIHLIPVKTLKIIKRWVVKPNIYNSTSVLL